MKNKPFISEVDQSAIRCNENENLAAFYLPRVSGVGLWHYYHFSEKTEWVYICNSTFYVPLED